jgi:hypothetical protein
MGVALFLFQPSRRLKTLRNQSLKERKNMADQEEILNQEPVSPAGEVVSPDAAEIEVPGTPATPEEDNEIAALEAAIEAAPTPEAKKNAQEKRNTAWAQNRRERQAAKEEAAKAREEAAFYRGQAEALQKAPATPAVTAAPVQPEVLLPPKPKPEEYTDADGYVDQAAHFEALADWKAECKFMERDAQRVAGEQRQKQEQAANAQQSWEQQGEAKFPGFTEKVKSRMMPILNTLDPGKFQALTGALSESPVSHDLAVYLSDNPTELRRLTGLSPFAAIKEIGYLEKKLEKPKPKTTTNAPTPITPVQTGGEAITNLMDIKDDDAYFREVKKRGRPY